MLPGALFALAGEVRHDTDHALHEHQLSAMVHLVLLGAQEALEAGPGMLPGRIGEVSCRNSGVHDSNQPANRSPSASSNWRISAFDRGCFSAAIDLPIAAPKS